MIVAGMVRAANSSRVDPHHDFSRSTYSYGRTWRISSSAACMMPEGRQPWKLWGRRKTEALNISPDVAVSIQGLHKTINSTPQCSAAKAEKSPPSPPSLI
jgi:hypothetical protein